MWDAERIIAYAAAVAEDFTQEKGGDLQFQARERKAVNKKAAEKEKRKGRKIREERSWTVRTIP